MVDPDSAVCEIVLSAPLVSLTLTIGTRTLTVKTIELVELTGDTQPEVHIAAEVRGGGPREEWNLHTIYTAHNGSWHEAKIVTLCLAFSTFEVRPSPSGGQEIYLDEDRHCEPPWSSERNYTVMRWIGSEFAFIESGVIKRSTTNPWWWNLVCISPFVGLACGLGGLGLVISASYERLRRRAKPDRVATGV